MRYGQIVEPGREMVKDTYSYVKILLFSEFEQQIFVIVLKTFKLFHRSKLVENVYDLTTRSSKTPV